MASLRAVEAAGAKDLDLEKLILGLLTDADAKWVFVADQLNTHHSATLVELVARRCGIPQELGVKGQSGILQSKQTRREFLQDPTHRIRFVCTPRHCSWLNQVEIWFSILAQRLLKRASFTSLDNLQTRVLDFIRYFNHVLAKPFRWNYNGRPSRREISMQIGISAKVI